MVNVNGTGATAESTATSTTNYCYVWRLLTEDLPEQTLVGSIDVTTAINQTTLVKSVLNSV